jgi:hypothetical protein
VVVRVALSTNTLTATLDEELDARRLPCWSSSSPLERPGVKSTSGFFPPHARRSRGKAAIPRKAAIDRQSGDGFPCNVGWLRGLIAASCSLRQLPLPLPTLLGTAPCGATVNENQMRDFGRVARCDMRIGVIARSLEDRALTLAGIGVDPS